LGYIPNTDKDREKMLSSLGASSIEALFSDIPKEVSLKNDIPLPAALSEIELTKELAALSEKNSDLKHNISFLGAGVYNHFIPAVVDHLAGRSEFYTSYTPYQAEISQGMLQAIYEYQTMICNLTGMEVANASMYDGATAAAEAALLTCRHTGKKVVLVSKSLHPGYREVVKTYCGFASLTVKEIGFTEKGTIDSATVASSLSDDTACLIISQPNFFGCVEDIKGLAGKLHAKGALFIVSVDPISLGVLAAPSTYGADIVTGEGLSLGSPPSFGGPGLGLFAAKKELVRLVPGRLVGATVDTKGQRGFALTLQTREQHIRRERATSNICSNEALVALRAAIYLSYMGKQGLKKVAELCVKKARYAKEVLSKVPGFTIKFSSPSFKEFVLSCPMPAEKINKALLKEGIIGGLALSRFYPEMKDQMLVAVTELTGKQDIDLLGEKLRKITK
jgi:glycine dehydrogenase subunit 1